MQQNAMESMSGRAPPAKSADMRRYQLVRLTAQAASVLLCPEWATKQISGFALFLMQTVRISYKNIV